MARVKSPAARKHRKVLKQAKGFKQARSRRIKVAKEAVLHSGQYVYIGRKLRKRDMRKLWIMRINAAIREYDMSYSSFINKLAENKIEINRKMLAEMAVRDEEGFSEIVKLVK